MPPWSELRSRVRDEDVFPPEEAVGDDAAVEDDGAGADSNKDGSGAVEVPTNDAAVDRGAPGYSEFGMFLAPGGSAGEGAKVADGGGSTAAANME